MPEAKVLIDAIGYKPFLDAPDLATRRVTNVATHGQVVDLSDAEFKRLSDLGAVAAPGSDEAKLSRDEAVLRMTPNGFLTPPRGDLGLGGVHQPDIGAPLPGQRHEDNVANRNEAEAKGDAHPAPAEVAPEAYRFIGDAYTETDEQREAREASDEAGAKAAAKASDEAPHQTDTAETPVATAAETSGKSSRSK